MSDSYRIELEPVVVKRLDSITNAVLKRHILLRIGELASNPERKGYELKNPVFAGFRKRKATKNWRIVYTVDSAARVVHVVLVAERKPNEADDVYARLEDEIGNS